MSRNSVRAGSTVSSSRSMSGTRKAASWEGKWWSLARATIQKAGGTVTSFGGVEPKDVDYTPTLTKIIQTENPDALVYCTNFPTSAGLMVKQARQLGFKKPIIGCDGYFDPAMIKAA